MSPASRHPNPQNNLNAKSDTAANPNSSQKAQNNEGCTLQAGELARLIKQSRRITGFTGAGLSTESGISDYRSQGGIWDCFQPVYYQQFLKDPESRLLHWQRKLEMWPQFRDARPNRGHTFFTLLHKMDKLTGVITQNVDGLHEQSGLPPEKLVRLHGTNREIICLKCAKITPAAEFYPHLDLSLGAPCCQECGGLLKPNTVSFGQNLDPQDLHQAEEFTKNCDLMLALGSTLLVYPAAGFPETAMKHGAALAILTLSETPFDSQADIVIHRPIGEVLAKVEQLL